MFPTQQSAWVFIHTPILQYPAEAYQLLLASEGVSIKILALTIWLYDVH